MVGLEAIPTTGSVLFVATHRNGAFDAAAYSQAAPGAVAVVSAQLHRSLLGRWLFPGIAVSRAKDKARGIYVDNTLAIKQCIKQLKGGGRLLIMPEGTSKLGFRHLPFQRGAARILAASITDGVEPVIVPLAVHYEDATIWQSRVEVLIGPALRPQTNDEKALHHLIVDALEAVGTNFPDSEMQRLAEQLAYAATLDTDHSYAKMLKRFEQDIPKDLADAVYDLERIAKKNTLWLHQGLPLVPIGPWQLDLAYWLMLAPIIVGFCLVNFPVLAAGYTASRILPDDNNVVAFWRMTVGLPAAFLWALVVSVSCLLFSKAVWLIGYWLLSVNGVLLWYHFRKLSLALGNAFLYPAAAKQVLAGYHKLKERLNG